VNITRTEFGYLPKIVLSHSLAIRYNRVMNKLTRITFNPNVMGGKLCIRGMRVTVNAIVGLFASGSTFAEILAAYPYLEEDD